MVSTVIVCLFGLVSVILLITRGAMIGAAILCVIALTILINNLIKNEMNQKLLRLQTIIGAMCMPTFFVAYSILINCTKNNVPLSARVISVVIYGAAFVINLKRFKASVK